jgi:hypothetical protein
VQQVCRIGRRLIMLRYMHEYGWKHGDFALLYRACHAVQTFAHRDKISLEKFERAS